MSKISNAIQMLNYLNTGNKYSVKELAEKLEITPRMVRYYKSELEQAGIPIETFMGPNGGYYLVHYGNQYPQFNKYDDILEKILYNMNAEEIDRIENENMISITAYSKLLDKNYLEYLGNKINLNIGIRYSEDEDKTLIYIATPIIKLDY